VGGGGGGGGGKKATAVVVLVVIGTVAVVAVVAVVVVVVVVPLGSSDALGLVVAVVVPCRAGPPTVMRTRRVNEDVLLRATRANTTVRCLGPGSVPITT
jgi:hypothetical protein